MIFKRKKYIEISPKEKVEIKKELWIKCEKCGKLIYTKKLEENLKVCPECNFHFRMTAKERINSIIDQGTFVEKWANLLSDDPLNFVGVKSYKEKLEEEMRNTGMKEAIMTGTGEIGDIPVAISVLDSHFIMGSMGSVVGEKFTRLCELAIEKGLPLVSFSGGGGGARMYEGVISLMQMAKTAAAVGKLKKHGILYISVLTDPTMGGVAASFAFLGDIIIAEPKALIGFAGPRVIEQTIKQKLPPGFQTSEFLYEHGLIDMVVDRRNLKETIIKILRIFHL
ncbi:MAG: acetyl-CoA carboxylase, carboxyltransferase subunit beta [Candidatus Omnitrophica bacterium]|nr:acetyl-CoA carboxylase, carboxyltransferase subunit beta [Candidatus Omnitrophota bacterium]MCM8810527.1 acetyl-CoA carboxylase, carboxyltransferase subunit beta [Candidatus Omnitrophota bacterium]